MKVLNRKWQILLYGCAGMGVNMLNLIVGSYLCSALLVGGFDKNVEFWTYVNKDLVIAGLWSAFILAAKIIDGVIDIPMASFTDNLRSRYGRRRPAIFGGMILMIAAYLMFVLMPTQDGATILNTILFGVALCLFYSFYTLTMVTYYATFSEIVDNEDDRMFLSNVKSVCDIVYFILGYALLPILVNNHMNIKTVALVFLPLVLTMLIPLIMIKGDDNRDLNLAKEKSVSLVRSVAFTFKDKTFLLWMIVYSFMTMGVQLFLGGINEFFSTNDLSMTFVMMGAFAPVPFTLILYNKLTKKKGFGFSFGYTLIVYAIGMIAMFFGQALADRTAKLVFAIASAVVGSFGIGSLFSVAYSVPAQLAVEEQERSGISHSAMYFAVQGLFSGVASGIATGLILVWLKQTKVDVLGMGEKSAVVLMTLLAGVFCLVACAFIPLLPKRLKEFGKEEKTLRPVVKDGEEGE